MFAALPPMQQFPVPSPLAWTPSHTSLLSPRRPFCSQTMTTSTSTSTSTTTPIQQPHIQSQLQTQPCSTSSIFAFSPSSHPPRHEPNPSSRTTNTTTPTSNYATRYATNISNPLQLYANRRTFQTSTSPSARAVRRNAFFNRVRKDREDGRSGNRAEQLLFMEGIAEQRAWVDGMRRRAEEVEIGFGFDPAYEEDDLIRADEAEFRALNEYLEQERALLERELLDILETESGTPVNMLNDHLSDSSSSFSDEEYDDIFSDLAHHSPPHEDTDMHMSG
ncbi:hypothetical protein BDW59DRAFT_30868 [Aspergillus cavernicola]|uniref:RPA-interacting protein N-terminal domain-containing protein n=1 Tax=Aspergillus cavernicola TaxID=176166 RepID=A0ABR4HDE3_9EURO